VCPQYYNEFFYVLRFSPPQSRPERMILTHLAVPPAVIRPTVIQERGTHEDDVTHRIDEILLYTASLESSVKDGMKMGIIQDRWDVLQAQVFSFHFFFFFLFYL
jgi:DNA-directed RNA polymerase III subunit RPC1